MRYSPDHKEKTRNKLLEVSGALSKKQGFATTGVDRLMAAAGLTSGALYSHFGSKSAFFQALIRHELERSRKLFQPQEGETGAQRMERSLADYLSLTHAHNAESGCALPALSGEIARAEPEVRRTYRCALQEMVGMLAEQGTPPAEAWAVIAQCMGALLMARAMDDDAVREEVLAASRAQLRRMLSDEPATPTKSKKKPRP
ncbi:MAG: TetR/AcrR family transcriptional regulator [Aquabacterium sp.]|nr:MAG: TetR/AcrR family transcriptional regulator [Aquabacterium sp.]